MTPKSLLISLSIAGVLCFTRSAQQPDNTKTNQRDRSATAATASKVGNSASDREIMQKIRKSLTEDK